MERNVRWGIAVIGAVILIGAGIAAWKRESLTPAAACRDFTEAHLAINDTEFAVALADTYEERVQGLSGCQRMPEESGMYFVFSEPQQTAFWMKDMLIPIDIIWIAQGQVVGLEANVPPPGAGVSPSDLPQYPAPQPIDAVLELPAGGAAAHGIQPGMAVTRL